MAVNKAKLEKDILEILNAVSDIEIDPQEARKKQAKGFAKAISDQILNVDAEVTGVTTAGSATAQTQSNVVKAKIS